MVKPPKFENDPRQLNQIWNKLCVVVTSHSLLEIVLEVIEDSETIEEARSRIEDISTSIRVNNTHDFKEWLKRYLKL